MDYSILSSQDTAVYVGCWDPCPESLFFHDQPRNNGGQIFLIDLKLNEAFRNRHRIVSRGHSLIQVQLHM